jgi:hypothetical protein
MMAALAVAALAAGSCDYTPPQRCDPLMVGGCGQNMKCSYLLAADLEPHCHTIAGTHDFEEFCSHAADDCGPGLQCIGDPSGMVVICRQYCGTDSDCPDGRLCNQVLPGGEHLCNDPPQSCDPLQQNCPSGQGCYAAPYGGFRCYTPRPNAAHPGEECPMTQACIPGSTCVPDASSNSGARCYQFCDPSGAACPEGKTCMPAIAPYTFSSCQ